jgi:CubicO group peptidase (beta-lactamase class C family)
MPWITSGDQEYFMKRILASLIVTLAVSAPVQSRQQEAALMQGFPPAKAQRVSRENFMVPPYNRWAFQHIRELQPTREVYRGEGPVSPLAEAPIDLADRDYQVGEKRKVSLDDWLEESATDAFLVMQHGKIVYERYLNNQQEHTLHQMFSATKSFIGTLVLMMIEEGRIDPSRTMMSYVAELEGSAFGGATVQQVLDMTTSISFSEEYTDPEADIWAYGYVFGLSDVTDPGQRKSSVYDYLPTLQPMPKLEHGEAFHYVTPNTDALAWLLAKVTGESVSSLIATAFLQPLGAQRDAYMWLDRSGTEMAGGGLNITARDAARFGQMILQKGQYHGRQVIPRTVAERILAAGNPQTFSKLYKDPWYTTVGHSYHDQWWSYRNSHNAVSAIGVHGQYIYIDPVAEMVVVKQSSHAEAEGDSNDVDGPLIWQAIAERLLSRE